MNYITSSHLVRGLIDSKPGMRVTNSFVVTANLSDPPVAYEIKTSIKSLTLMKPSNSISRLLNA